MLLWCYCEMPTHDAFSSSLVQSPEGSFMGAFGCIRHESNVTSSESRKVLRLNKLIILRSTVWNVGFLNTIIPSACIGIRRTWFFSFHQGRSCPGMLKPLQRVLIAPIGCSLSMKLESWLVSVDSEVGTEVKQKWCFIKVNAPVKRFTSWEWITSFYFHSWCLNL